MDTEQAITSLMNVVLDLTGVVKQEEEEVQVVMLVLGGGEQEGGRERMMVVGREERVERCAGIQRILLEEM